MPPKETLAFVNAALNATSAVLLVLAFVNIKRKNYAAHGWLMVSAFTVSAIFLTSYLTSHYYYGERTSGLKRGWLYYVYLLILLPHILLAVGMLPFIFTALYRAYRRDWTRHRRAARPALWIWLYVSVTGVVVYWMLYHLFPSLNA